MNKRLLLFTIIGFIILVIITTFYGRTIITFFNENDIVKTKEKNIQYFIMHNEFMIKSKIAQPHAAILIEDTQEINQNRNFFLSPKQVNHLCGYDYRLQFWYDQDSLLNSFPVNTSCEHFSYQADSAYSKINDYRKILEKAPTHFIYDIGLPVNVSPIQAKAAFKGSNYKLFFFNQGKDRFPTMLLFYKKSMADYSREQNNDTHFVKNHLHQHIYNMLKKSDIDTSTLEHLNIQYQDQKYQQDPIYTIKVLLKFRIGTDLHQKIEGLINNGASIKYFSTPSLYYMQLIDTSNDVEHICKMMKPFSIVKDIKIYNGNEGFW